MFAFLLPALILLACACGSAFGAYLVLAGCVAAVIGPQFDRRLRPAGPAAAAFGLALFLASSAIMAHRFA